MLSWFILMDDFFKATILHLEVFNFRKLSSVNFLMVEICASSGVVVEANVRMSSACRKLPTYRLFADTLMESDCSCHNRGSITSTGDRMDSCRTPRPSAKEEDYADPYVLK